MALNLLARPCPRVLHRGWAMALSSLLLQDLPDEVCAAGAHMAATWLTCPEEEEGGHLQAPTRGCKKVGCRGPCASSSHSKCRTTSLRHSSLCDTQLGAGPCSKPACCTIQLKLVYELPATANTGSPASPQNMELTSTILNSLSSCLVSSEASPMSRAKLANLQVTEQLSQHNTGCGGC